MTEEVEIAENIYDVVVFGATGFTGQFVVEEIARTIDEEPGLKWAIAGRNMEKCQAILRQASKRTGKELEELPIIMADIKIQQSLLDMAKQAKVVLNCVGPYRFYGDQVVRACVENKASHIDISGEPGFLEKCQLLYHSKAKEAGIYVIGSCGFDSIPADLGVVYTAKQFDGDCNAIEGYLSIKAGPEGGSGHYATWQSAIHGFANQKETAKQRKLLLPNPLPKPAHKMPKRGNMFFSDDVQTHCLPFPGSDRSVVFRSQHHRYHDEKQRPVQFNAYISFPSWFSTIMTVFVGIIFGTLSSFGFGRTLLETFPRFFSFGMFSHEGPTRKQIDGTTFSYTFIAHGYENKVDDADKPHEDEPTKKIITKVAGPEPGYVTTPICMVQAAYALLAGKDNLPDGGGVYTPAAALGKTNIIERLDKHNLKFSVVEK